MQQTSPDPGSSDGVPALIAALLKRRLILVTGKGGIGKTLVAAGIGQAAAALGKRVLLLEFGAVDQLAPLFGVSSVGHERREVLPGLFCANINPDDNFKDFIVKYLGQQKLFDRVISHRVIQTFIKTIPGLAELMLLGRLYFEGTVAPGPRFDLIIFDGPASGHFLNMMTTPDAVLRSNIVGPLRKETQKVRDFLAEAHNVGTLYVTIPEDLVISEALEFLPKLAEQSPAPILGVIMNKVPPQLMRRSVSEDVGQTSEVTSEGASKSPEAIFKAAWQSQERRATKALAHFSGAVESVGLKYGFKTWCLPDLFAVEEPLVPGFWKKLFGPSNCQKDHEKDQKIPGAASSESSV